MNEECNLGYTRTKTLMKFTENNRKWSSATGSVAADFFEEHLILKPPS